MALIWLNDRLVEAADARIDPADRGLLLGDGLFETMRAIGGTVVALDLHLRRLAEGAAVLGIALPAERVLVAAIEAVVGSAATGDAAIRLTVTRGPGPRGLLPPDTARPTLLVTTAPMPPAPHPARVVISSIRRNAHSPLSRIKSLAYLDNVLALRAARAAGADDAILLNADGRVACATAANIFAAVGGRLVTPPVEDGVLPGITRARLLDLAGAVDASLTPDDLTLADEVLLTSSLIRIRPVVAIDGRPVGSGAPGPLAARLSGAL